MRKVTVKTASDIALIKYWGKKDEVLRLPENGSLSIKLDGLDTVTTVEFRSELTKDEVVIEGESQNEETSRVIKHLDRIRQLYRDQADGAADRPLFAQVMSTNTFPKGTGLSSSGSGFAALTVAATLSLGMELTERELSILARQGSGTACRCICGGFVEWLDGETSETSYSQTILPQDAWDIRDVVVVVDEAKKLISSTEGHEAAATSPFFQARQERIGAKLKQMKDHILAQSFSAMGELAEREALEFHSILLTQSPPLVAWYPGTVEVMHAVRQLRDQGVECYFTINTGFNVHVLTQPQDEERVRAALEKLSLVKKVLTAKIGGSPVEINQHLF